MAYYGTAMDVDEVENEDEDDDGSQSFRPEPFDEDEIEDDSESHGSSLSDEDENDDWTNEIGRNVRRSPSRGIVEYLSVGSICPRSYLFFIIAKVGPNHSHRPLAIAFRQGNGTLPGRNSDIQAKKERVNHVYQDCVNLIDSFSSPSNRTALEAELGLASAWYQAETYSEPPRTVIPDTLQPPFHFDELCYLEDPPKRLELPELPNTGKFPFISSCLCSKLHEHNDTNFHDIQEQPLGTVFQDDRVEYGMVVLDISNLDCVSIGFISHKINYMAEVEWRDEDEDWDPVEDDPPRDEPVPVIEGSCSREPLTYAGFMSKYPDYPGHDPWAGVTGYNEWPVIEAAALDYIWPNPEETVQKVQGAGGIDSDVCGPAKQSSAASLQDIHDNSEKEDRCLQQKRQQMRLEQERLRLQREQMYLETERLCRQAWDREAAEIMGDNVMH